MQLDWLRQSGRFSFRACGALAIVILAFAASGLARVSAAELSGEAIFKTKCAVCHGAHGEGTKKHEEPLEGSKSLAQLVDLITKSMPEDDPGTLSKNEADAVAHYVFDAIYSPEARERTRPARVELARLTVRQYRLAVADLVGGSSPPEWGNERGLKAEYYSGRNFRGKGKVEERIDPQVNFDFGDESPIPDKIDAHEFSIRWVGSLLAAETGQYEFTIHTDHAARLWVNDNHHPLIDAWVKSGSDTDYRGSIFLVGGRPYRLRLEFTKGKTGVDDSKKQKEKPPPAKAFIALKWQRPLGAEEPIPSRQLSTVSPSEVFVCATPFPPDDRSYGWERGTSVSKEWDVATTDAAIDTAAYVIAHVNDLAGTHDDDKDRGDKLRAYCRTLAERAFRRPLSGDDAKRIIDKQFDAAKDLDSAVKRVVLRVLKSPRFLYREIGGKGDSYNAAARLSFGLWDSLPDRPLLDEAKAGRLCKHDEFAQQAQRMLEDLRAKAKLHEFLLSWVKADQVRDLAKDSKKFPEFDAATIADLRTSLELFLDDVAWSEKSDFRKLLSADYLFLNGRLAKIYGADLPADADFTKVKLDAAQRAGVLTHPFLMASFAHTADTSPILRGVFLARGVLALSLRPPPEAVVPLSPELQPTLTTRERVTMQTQAANCMICHGIINPLGFALEHFDAVGRYREKDNDKPVDSTGVYHARNGKKITVNGARELATFLAESDEAQSAFVEQMFHSLVQQPIQAYGPYALDDLRHEFAESGFNIRKLAVAIMTISAPKQSETKLAVGK
jgi:mono/diheme cytochrome c family protein